MIQVDVSNARPFVADEVFEKAFKTAQKSLSMVWEGSGKGAEWLGWRDVPEHRRDRLLSSVREPADIIQADADVCIVCGIGGSYLGARAVIEALKPFPSFGSRPEMLYAGHHMSGRYLQELIRYLEVPKPDGSPKSVWLNVISKSGSTLEPALAFRVLRSWMEERYGEQASERIICTTGEEGGKLNLLARQHGYKKLIIPDDIGGRFSVLTPVGLLPLQVAGIDTEELMDGAAFARQYLKKDPLALLEYVAVRAALGKEDKALDLIAVFEPELDALGRWLQQLLGESEGKDGKGLFPVVCNFSTDLHSLGQMIQQGRRNLMETFIVVKQPRTDLTPGENAENADGLNYLSGRTFHEINSMALKGTLEAHVEGGVPAVMVALETADAFHIGSFIYFYELFTAVYGYSLGLNPFDQPGVEAYKNAMYRLLQP